MFRQLLCGCISLKADIAELESELHEEKAKEERLWLLLEWSTEVLARLDQLTKDGSQAEKDLEGKLRALEVNISLGCSKISSDLDKNVHFAVLTLLAK